MMFSCKWQFARNNSAFKQENADLEMDVSRLERAERELAMVNNSLKATTRAYEENIEKFRSVCNQ